jgi:hypothetical protein
MSPEAITIIGVVSIFVLTTLFLLLRKFPKRVKSSHYIKKWREIQKLRANKDDWPHAVVHADMLLDEVMKKKKIGGKTTGERMVNAQGKFSANDSVWNAHKLANSIRQEAEKTITESVVKDTLIAFRQALRDLGAIK